MGTKIVAAFVVVIGAVALADMVAHPQGSSAVFSGVNNIATSAYQGASGAYTKA